MARRISLSQFKNKVRQLQNKQKRAIDDYNRAVKNHNQKVRQSINKYNQQVRTHNSRVRANRQRLQSALNRISQNSSTTKYVVYRKSTVSLSATYDSLDRRSINGDFENQYNHYLDLSEKETANSLEVLNSLENPEENNLSNQIEVSSRIIEQLQSISPDLDSRWKGAMFSLNPSNPDAARHFCTSSREIITSILEISAPDDQVLQYEWCNVTDHGKPTRKSKINYLLFRKGLNDGSFQNFVNDDIDNVLELYRIFNDGTHGSAGKFTYNQLLAIKNRVQDSVSFLVEIAN